MTFCGETMQSYKILQDANPVESKMAPLSGSEFIRLLSD